MSSTSRHIPLFLKCFFQAISWPKSWPRGSVHAGCSASEADLVERTRQDMQTVSIQTLVASAMPMWGFKVPEKSEHVEKHEPRYADVLDLWSIRGIETAKKLDLFQPKWGMSQPEMRVGQSIPIVDIGWETWGVTIPTFDFLCQLLCICPHNVRKRQDDGRQLVTYFIHFLAIISTCRRIVPSGMQTRTLKI